MKIGDRLPNGWIYMGKMEVTEEEQAKARAIGERLMRELGLKPIEVAK